MKRIIRCIYCLAVPLVYNCADTPKTKPEEPDLKPNVILIMTDDQGWGDLSLNGNKNLNTPNIDKLAEEGVSFENFYVQPVCSPTRAEMLTGRYHTRLGVYDTSAGGERFDLEETTLAEVLKDAGYHTAAYGKWHSGMQPPYHPNARGFDDYYGFASGHWGTYFDPMLEHNGFLVQGKGFLVDDLTNHGLNFIDQHKNEPFFIYLPYNTPHSPMQVPDQYWDRIKHKDLEQKYHGSQQEDSMFTKAALAMVENIDFNVGRISKKLKELEIEENTIIIFMSDNGPNGWRYNGRMRGKKGSTDEGGVRSPFFIKWKNTLTAGTSVNEIAGAIDILPTLAELTNSPLATKKPLDGASLKPLLFDANEKWNPRLIFNHWNERTAVRSQKYRLDEQNRLYDIELDRGQTADIASQFPEITASLINAKKTWLDEMKSLDEKKDDRPFTLGHPQFEFTQIPARDGIPYGNIERSNRWPNDSFFMNWTSLTDSISWDVEVLENGKYEVSLLYTLAEGDEGVAVQLNHGQSKLITRITEAHDPPLMGKDNDRVLRGESYVKDFKTKKLGTMSLRKGRRPLVLKAMRIPGKEAMNVRLLFFKRI